MFENHAPEEEGFFTPIADFSPFDSLPEITVETDNGRQMKRSCAAWLEEYLSSNLIVCSTSGAWTHKGRPIDLVLLLKQIFADAERAGSGGFPAATIASHIGLISGRAAKRRVDEVRKAVTFTGSNTALTEYASIMFGLLPAEELTFRTACLAQFIWQVKRKLFGFGCNDPLMVVLQGSQGIGKSAAVVNLIKPFSGLSVESDVDKLLDSRSYRMVADNYIIFLDELAKAAQTDVAALKGLLSSNAVSGRPMGTNAVDKVVNNATFIATVQLPLAEVIRDPTGMRRFVELSLPSLPTPEDGINKAIALSAFAEAHGLLIWQGVDENGPSPMSNHRLELAKRQTQITAKSYLEDWADNYDLRQPMHFIPSNLLYGHFNDYLKSIGQHRHCMSSCIEFSRKLGALLGQAPIQRRVNGERLRGLLVGQSIASLFPSRSYNPFTEVDDEAEESN